jgi:iron(III) transport system ATP-binding protein
MGRSLRRQIGTEETLTAANGLEGRTMSQAAVNSLSRGAPAAQAGEAAREPFLVLENVVKRFGRFVALDGVSLSIQPGEFVSFVGPSGCGKTTLLCAVAGLDPATSGRIVQAGRDITALPPSERDFGIVFQSYALFPNMTAAQNIGYGLRGREWPKARARERVRELIALIGLDEHAQKYPSLLSGGQQQRVALARALAAEPGLLLLDEPLSALDAIVRLHLRSEIRALQRRLGVTTIMVTHDQEEAMSVSDRLVVMSRGRIEQVGSPEHIYRQPVSGFVANFIGSSTHLDGIVEAGGVVRAKGLALRADSAAGMASGTQVRAFIRPEDVFLGRSIEAYSGAMQCTLVNLEYLGPVCHVAVQAGDAVIEADIRSDQLGELDLGSDRPIPLRIPADRVLVFPSSV